MLDSCPGANLHSGVIKGVLRSVDCHVETYSKLGYLALSGPDSVFPVALTAMLTLYVAFVGYQLLFGSGGFRLSSTPLMAIKIGAILALTLNWPSFETLVLDLAMKAPLQIAVIVAKPAQMNGGALAQDPLGGLQVVYDQLVADAAALGKVAGLNGQALGGGPAGASQGLWAAANALLMSSAGLLALSTIATGVLVATGPVFIALFMFDATRGLFSGWVRALTATALMPMACWIVITLMLIVMEPWLLTLARSRIDGQMDLEVASAVTLLVFVFSGAQIVLAVAAALIAAGFRLPRPGRAATSHPDDRHAPVASVQYQLSRPGQIAQAMQRSAAFAQASLASESAPTTRSAPAHYTADPAFRRGESYQRSAFRDRLISDRRGQA